MMVRTDLKKLAVSKSLSDDNDGDGIRYFCVHCQLGYFSKEELKAHNMDQHPNWTRRCGICHNVFGARSRRLGSHRHTSFKKTKTGISELPSLPPPEAQDI